jgi:hypothetical protein
MPEPRLRISFVLALLVLLVTGLLPAPALGDAVPEGVPFKYIGGHIMTVPVRLSDNIGTTFIFDTGAGVSLISQKLADKLHCATTGTHSGQRMSGQTLQMPTCAVSSLRFGSCVQKNVPVGIWNMTGFIPDTAEFAGIEGFLSLNYFKNVPFTIDYPRKRFYIENEQSMKVRHENGVVVPVVADSKDNVEYTISVRVSVSKVVSALAVVDTGSGSLILDEKFMKRLGVDPDGKVVEAVDGTDETGNKYRRYFTTLPEAIHLTEAPKISQMHPRVQFQKIIHDGLIGDSFLSQFVVTYDLAHSQLIFARSGDTDKPKQLKERRK